MTERQRDRETDRDRPRGGRCGALPQVCRGAPAFSDSGVQDSGLSGLGFCLVCRVSDFRIGLQV